MLSQSQLVAQNHTSLLSIPSSPSLSNAVHIGRSAILFPNPSIHISRRHNLSFSRIMTSNAKLQSGVDTHQLDFSETQLTLFTKVGNKVADAAGEVIRKYFRNKLDILDKEDMSPVTVADKGAEEAMVSVILENFPSHAIFGEENGWRCKEKTAEYVWVLDPIDGTKSFITGKPLFGTLIALLHKGQPHVMLSFNYENSRNKIRNQKILGIIDQPILRERWIGVTGRRTTMNGEEVSTRACLNLSEAYLYTTSPHLFSGDAEEAFIRVRNKVKVPLYGCDCYAYALLSSGYVDLVIESGLKPYDFLALIPVIEGSGGVVTDWKGRKLCWDAAPQSPASSFNVLAAGDRKIHGQALDSLEWR